MPDLDSLLKPLAELGEQNAVSASAYDFNPADEGRLMDTARRTGLSMELLRGGRARDIDDLLVRDQRRAILERNAKVAEWMSRSPGHAGLSYDDADGLEGLSQASFNWIRAQAEAPTTADRVVAGAYSILRAPVTGLGGLLRAAGGGGSFVANAVGAEGAREWFDAVSTVGSDVAAYARSYWRGTDIEDELAEQRTISEINPLRVNIFGADISAEDVIAGAYSLVPTILAGAASGGATWAITAAAAAQSFGGAYATLNEEGDKYAGVKASAAALITGALTLAMPNMEKTLSNMLRGSVDPKAALRGVFASVIGKQAASEMVEEGLDEFLQNYLVFGRSFEESMSAAVEAGIIGGILGGGTSVAEARMAVTKAQADAAIKFMDATQNLVSSASASKTGQRSKTAVAEFVASHGPELSQSSVYIATEDAQELLADQKAFDTLRAAGVSEAALEAARKGEQDLELPLVSIIADLSDEMQQAIMPLIRQTPDAMSGKEAAEVRDADDAGSGGKKAERKKLQKEFEAEKRRLTKEIAKAQGIDKESARAIVTVMAEGAVSLFSRNPAAGKSPIDILKKIKVTKDGLAEARQAIVDAAGPQGKVALKNVSLSSRLGGKAARVDVLTGHAEVNPAVLAAVNAVDEVMAKVRGVQTADVSGKTVRVQDETGAEADVDAEEVVATLRERITQARRLKGCVG